MTNRELVLKTIAFEKTDVIPSAILNGQMWINARHNLTVGQLLDLPDAGAQLLVDDYKEMETSIMTAGCAAAWPMMSVMGGEINMDSLAAEIITPPLSDIKEIDNYSVEEVIAKIREDHYYQRALLQTKNMRENVGDEYLIGGGFFGPFTLAAQMVGLSNFMLALGRDKEGYVGKILDFAAEISIASLEDLIENGLDLITIPEPVASGDLISPRMFKKIVIPVDNKVKEALKEKCPNVLLHICGKTQKQVPILAENDYGIFSVDSIDMIQAQEESAGRLALFGCLNTTAIMLEKTADEVYEIAKKLCQDMKPYGGFILAPGCDIPPNIPLENLKAMARAAREA